MTTKRNTPTYMSCGCVAQAHRGGEPICMTHREAVPAPVVDLTGRKARCTYCGHEVQSALTLPFFEFKGVGSLESVEVCVCGYYRCAHEENRRSGVLACKQFRARGPRDYDRYYCGCRGWD